MLGQKLLPTLISNSWTFTQQLDHLTGAPSGRDGYGPMILAALAYLNRMHGIHLDVAHGQVWWSAIAEGGHDFTRIQRWSDTTWKLECKDDQVRAFINGKEVFTGTAGARFVTTLDGKLLKVVGIDPEKRQVTVQQGERQWSGNVAPNAVLSLRENK